MEVDTQHERSDVLNWAECKEIAYERQSHICDICGQFMKKYVGHHIKNRCQRGKKEMINDPENCRVRHFDCEALAHKLHPFGNPTPRQVEEALNDPAEPAVRDRHAKRRYKSPRISYEHRTRLRSLL